MRRCFSAYLPGTKMPEETDAHWQDAVRPTHGFFALDDVCADRGALRWRPLRKIAALCRAFPHYGLCAAYLSREFARHRSLSVGPSLETLPPGFSRSGSPHHALRCQRSPRLAHLCRLRPSAHSSGQETLRVGNSCSRTLRNGLRTGFHAHRSVLIRLPLGALPLGKGRRETAHAAG